jgi:2-alkenal reductase
MRLPENQQGILVEQVLYDSPADRAGLRGSFKPLLIQGTPVLVGGDILLIVDEQPLTHMDDLVEVIQQAQPGQQVTFTLLRAGKLLRLTATLTAPPTTTP